MPVERGNPWRFHRSTKWKKCRDDFFHGQPDLPNDDLAMNVIINAESSDCYPSRMAFFDEVYRVLPPGGIFCYAVLHNAGDRAPISDWLTHSGFITKACEDITLKRPTPSGLRGRQHNAPRRTDRWPAMIPRDVRERSRTLMASGVIRCASSRSRGTRSQRPPRSSARATPKEWAASKTQFEKAVAGIFGMAKPIANRVARFFWKVLSA